MKPLSGLDASFLYLETPSTPMSVYTLIVCDPQHAPGGFSFEKFVAFIQQKAMTAAIFRKRLIQIPLQLYYPVWIDDPEFDIVHHVRHVLVQPPGGMVELGDLVGRLAQGTLDRRYPLWEIYYIDGLANGRVGIFAKVHHALVDGMTGAGLMMQLLEMQPRAFEPQPYEKPQGEPVPSDAELLAYAWRELTLQPGKLFKVARRSLENLRSLLQKRQNHNQAESRPLLARAVPPTHFNKPVGPHRGIAFVRLPLAKIKELKNATSTTVNDVILTICGTALREFLLQKNDLPAEPLTATCPVSVHGKKKAAGSNNVSGMRTTLATHVADPLERLQLIHAETVTAKKDLDAVGADLLQDWAEVISPHIFNLAVRMYSRTSLSAVALPHNVIVSNVPGPRFPLYLAGAKIEAVYPIGPVFAGCGLNITLFSYADSVDFGLFVDRSLVPDVWDLAAKFPLALEQLLAAAKLPTSSDTVAVPPTATPPPRKLKNAKSKRKTQAPSRLGRDPLAAVKNSES